MTIFATPQMQKNNRTVLFDPFRFQMVARLIREGGAVAVADMWKMVGATTYSATEPHIAVLARADVIDVEMKPAKSGAREVRTLIVTNRGRQAFNEQRAVFKELAAI
jgi:hypothetical protein